MPGRPRFSADTSAFSSTSSAREVLTKSALRPVSGWVRTTGWTAVRSFSAAAEKHGITQSAASQRIGQLEKQLGVTLIDRSVRK